jgi:hypothetical protein
MLSHDAPAARAAATASFNRPGLVDGHGRSPHIGQLGKGRPQVQLQRLVVPKEGWRELGGPVETPGSQVVHAAWRYTDGDLGLKPRGHRWKGLIVLGVL